MTMRIGEVSEATGVNIRLLRYYKERGLLRPNRTPAGQRVFNNDAVDRVQQIRKLLSAGLNTDRIATFSRVLRRLATNERLTSPQACTKSTPNWKQQSGR